jgi:hypothetical protein
MKLSKDELKQKINDLSVDDDVKITLLEDVEDSFETTEDNGEELTELQTKYDELKEKYKNRFLTGKDEKKDEVEKKEDGLDEQEIVEEKDIFKEEED